MKAELDTANKSDRKVLKPNPFTTYRDSKTGQWIVVKSTPACLTQPRV